MSVYFIAAYFNRCCFAHIPGHWRAECLETGFYADGETREIAISTLRRLLAR
jgi:hypothetical protein